MFDHQGIFVEQKIEIPDRQDSISHELSADWLLYYLVRMSFLVNKRVPHVTNRTHFYFIPNFFKKNPIPDPPKCHFPDPRTNFFPDSRP